MFAVLVLVTYCRFRRDIAIPGFKMVSNVKDSHNCSSIMPATTTVCIISLYVKTSALTSVTVHSAWCQLQVVTYMYYLSVEVAQKRVRVNVDVYFDTTTNVVCRFAYVTHCGIPV